MNRDNDVDGFEWQLGIWDKMSGVYHDEVDQRFIPVIDGVLKRAAIQPGDHVLDIGTGTGAIALRSALIAGESGQVVASDISQDMLQIAERKAKVQQISNIEFRMGRAESIPSEDSSFDVVTASLSLMYVIDRGAAAREIARVLRPGGRFVAAVWASADECDIVLFQQTAGSFAPKPPVQGVGPGAMGNPKDFIDELSKSGVDVQLERVSHSFEFHNFKTAWDVLAGVTTAKLDLDVIEKAKVAVQNLMWNDVDKPLQFRNTTQYIIGHAQ
jgi:ubiquinone/menaquinone biosynthesis C-methylase UbiE